MKEEYLIFWRDITFLVCALVLLLTTTYLVYNYRVNKAAFEGGYIQVQDHGQGFHWEKAR